MSTTNFSNISRNITITANTIGDIPMTKEWTISGQNGLTGTVIQTDPYGLLWYLVPPTGHTFPDGSTTKYFYYGDATALPYTYVDGSGLDQMAVLNNGYVTFDQEYVGLGTSIPAVSAIDITPITTTISTGGTVGKISLQTWRIQGEQGLTGIVTSLPELGLVWNLKSASGVSLPSVINGISTTSLLPSGMTKAIPYGGPLSTPVVYVQSGGSYNNTDQMGVYHIGGFGGGAYDYALNTEYSGNVGINVASTAVTVVSSTAGYAKNIHYSVLNIITISPTSVSVQIGDTQQLTAACKDQYDADFTCPTLTWISHSPLTASVSSSGLVTGLIEGYSTITVTAEGKTSNSSVITVTIAPPAEAGASGLLIAGLAVGALLMMKKGSVK